MTLVKSILSSDITALLAEAAKIETTQDQVMLFKRLLGLIDIVPRDLAEGILDQADKVIANNLLPDKAVDAYMIISGISEKVPEVRNRAMDSLALHASKAQSPDLRLVAYRCLLRDEERWQNGALGLLDDQEYLPTGSATLRTDRSWDAGQSVLVLLRLNESFAGTEFEERANKSFMDFAARMDPYGPRFYTGEQGMSGAFRWALTGQFNIGENLKEKIVRRIIGDEKLSDSGSFFDDAPLIVEALANSTPGTSYERDAAIALHAFLRGKDKDSRERILAKASTLNDVPKGSLLKTFILKETDWTKPCALRPTATQDPKAPSHTL